MCYAMKDDEAAALVREAYGLECDEVGFFIAAPLSAGDIAAFARSGSDMQYGEVLPAGMAAIARELGVGGDCERLCELGSGTGKQALHLFLRHENVLDVLAVELSRDRCDVCRRAWRRVAAAHPTRYALDEAHWASASTGSRAIRPAIAVAKAKATDMHKARNH